MQNVLNSAVDILGYENYKMVVIESICFFLVSRGYQLSFGF